jgi:hypothetical protein
MTANQGTKTMTTFYPQQLDRGQCADPKAGAGTLQISATNCTAKLRSHVHEAGKIQCNNVSSTVRPQIIDSHFLQIEALPLVWTRFLRLVQISPMATRNPARRPRDDRETSGKTPGDMSRVIYAHPPGIGRMVAAAMPPNVCQDDLQANLLCAGLGRATSAQKPVRRPATWLYDNRVAANATSHKQLVGISSSIFNRDIQKL